MISCASQATFLEVTFPGGSEDAAKDLACHRLRGQDMEPCCFGLFQEPGRCLVLALSWSRGHPLPGGIYREQSSPPGSSQCDLLAAEDSKIFWGKDLLWMCRIQNWNSGTGLSGTLSQGGVSLRDWVAQSSWMCLDCTGERCIPERTGSSGVLGGFKKARKSVPEGLGTLDSLEICPDGPETSVDTGGLGVRRRRG